MVTSDCVLIDHLTFDAIIGIHPHERKNPQPLDVSLEVITNTAAAAASDHIDDAVDYSALADGVQQLAVGGQYHLVETLAAHIADYALANPAVRSVTVTVLKPQALEQARNVGVRITRTQIDQSDI